MHWQRTHFLNRIEYAHPSPSNILPQVTPCPNSHFQPRKIYIDSVSTSLLLKHSNPLISISPSLLLPIALQQFLDTQPSHTNITIPSPHKSPFFISTPPLSSPHRIPAPNQALKYPRDYTSLRRRCSATTEDMVQHADGAKKIGELMDPLQSPSMQHGLNPSYKLLFLLFVMADTNLLWDFPRWKPPLLGIISQPSLFSTGTHDADISIRLTWSAEGCICEGSPIRCMHKRLK